MIVRDGRFELDEKYIPVPWENFKVAPNSDLLLLDVSKHAMDAAPQIDKDQATAFGHFERHVEAFDTYRKTHATLAGDKG